MNFLYSVTVTPMSLFALKMNLLPTGDFVISHIGHVEHTGLVSYADVPKVDTYQYTVLVTPTC